MSGLTRIIICNAIVGFGFYCLPCKFGTFFAEITVRSRVHDIQEDWKPAFLSNEEFTYLVLEALEGFVMVFSATGRIYYVSESITSLLGHNVVIYLSSCVIIISLASLRTSTYW